VKLVITERAKTDFDGILLYIARVNIKSAEKTATALIQKITSIKRLPLRCPVAPESKFYVHEVRHLVYKSYRIIFTVRSKTVIILRIVHGAQSIEQDIF
jgi:plasmid stabilization system protein ParE